MRGSLILYLKGMRRMMSNFLASTIYSFMQPAGVGKIESPEHEFSSPGRYKNPYILHPSKPTLN